MRKSNKYYMVKKYLKEGDLITHTRCMGCIENHYFTKYEGNWICGKPSADTIKIEGCKLHANDISYNNITHINFVPLDALKFLSDNKI